MLVFFSKYTVLFFQNRLCSVICMNFVHKEVLCLYKEQRPLWVVLLIVLKDQEIEKTERFVVESIAIQNTGLYILKRISYILKKKYP